MFVSIADVKKFIMLGALTPAGESALPIRFCGVQGYDGRQNDVIYCHPVVRTEKQSTVVFFGGDMQVNKKKRKIPRRSLFTKKGSIIFTTFSSFLHASLIV